MTDADLSAVEHADSSPQGASGPAAGAGPRAGHAQRRVFSNGYKLRVVEEYDGLTEHGARGALLRREGLYQSHIDKWRRARDKGTLGGGHGPGGGAGRPAAVDGRGVLSENRRLQAENTRLTAELEQTRAVLDILGNAHALLEKLSESAAKTQPLPR